MGQSVDLGGNDLYVNAVYSGNSTAGQLTVSAQGAFQRFVLPAVNFNAGTTDTALNITLPTGLKNYVVHSVRIVNANHTLVTATVGVFSAAGGTGTTIAADQAITVTSGTANTALNTQALTLSPASTTAFNFPVLQIRVGTAEGAAATADVVVIIQLIN